jgi:hypothetical protein
VRKIHREKLADLGISSNKYVVLEDGTVIYDKNDRPADRGVLIPIIWGITLEHARWAMYVEYQTDEFGGRPRHYLRWSQGERNDLSRPFLRQQDAIAAAISSVYA